MPITGIEQLILFRDSARLGLGDRALQRAIASGERTRLRSGASVPTELWSELRSDDRRRLEAAAMAAMHPSFIAARHSARALQHLPSVLLPDGLVHARVSAASGSRTEHGVRKHAVHDVDQHLVVVDGVTTTSVERTALDLAATQPFHEAVVVMDAALRRGISKDRMRQVLDEWAPKQRRARIEQVIAFANPLAATAGESWSRVQMFEGGLPAPVLQQRFFDGRGHIGESDFWWPRCNLIGEFDGMKKYREADMLQGRTPGQVVEAEKIREDRLRRTETRPMVERWIWATLLVRGALVAQLRAAGLH